ncbi:cupin [bacterium]|nr:MAG: cupin [bacterium]
MKSDEIKKILELETLESEGGFFRETFRSQIEIDPKIIRTEYDGKRSLFTVIYYLLTDGASSTPHKLKSDEIWFFHKGDSIKIDLIYPDGKNEKVILGDNIENGEKLQSIIPAGTIQSAKIIDGEHKFALVSTVVIPGFDYKDFEILD